MFKGFNKDINLYVSQDEIGNIIANYCSPDSYNHRNNGNEARLFVNNLILSQILNEQSSGATYKEYDI